MQSIEKYVIDDKEYEIGHFMTSKATKLLTRITKFILGPLGASLSDVNFLDLDKIMESNITVDKAVMVLATQIDEEMVLSTIKELMSEVKLGTGMPISFETHFMGNTMHMFKIVRKVLEHNYGDFFGGLGGALRGAIARVATQGRQTSTSTSGDRSSRESRRSRK